MDSIKFLLLLLSFNVFIIIEVYSQNPDAPDYVPLYMWDTVKFDKTIPALNRIGKEDLKDLLTEKLENKDTVVIAFAEENLSPEDLTSFDSEGNNIYTKIPNIKKKKHVNYYPYVERPIEVLKSFKRDIVEISYEQVGDINPKPGQIIIINLNDAEDNEDRTEMLIRHDNIVYSVFKKLVANNNDIVALYTGRQSSWQNPNDEQYNEQLRSRRHLLEAADKEEDKSVLINRTTVLMYFNGSPEFKIYEVDKDNKVIKNENYTINDCNIQEVISENSTVLPLCLDDDPNKKLNFKFENPKDGGYWYLSNIIYENDNYVIKSDVYAPLKFSYHCITSDFVLKHNHTTVTVSIPNFQVQAFMNSTEAFDDAYDCVGFTSGPIWSGIFVTFILALIMTFGLCMIMEIKTMDRFDDPKGKTISINVSE